MPAYHSSKLKLDLDLIVTTACIFDHTTKYLTLPNYFASTLM